MELDNFKVINDTYGHDLGDQVLIAFATACQSTLRQSDRVGRYGGEEWLFVFPESDISIVYAIFSRLTIGLNQCLAETALANQVITFSVGIAVIYNAANHNLEALLRSADTNLYEAKHRGKDQCFPAPQLIQEVEYH